jgi:fucose permease
VLIRFSRLPEIENEPETIDIKETGKEKKNIFHFPHLWLGAIALFLYVGAEVMAGDMIIRYGISLGIPIAQAKIFTTYTLIFMIIGYVLIGLILVPKIISQRTALSISAVLGIIFTILAICTDSKTSVMFIALLGFANALIWPAIWPLAIHNLGRHIKTGSSVLIMMISGGAVLPLLWGTISDHYPYHPQNAYWLCIPCYLFIFFYALKGYKLSLK